MVQDIESCKATFEEESLQGPIMAECIENVQYMFDCMYPLHSENDKDLRAKQLELEWNRKDEAPPKPLDPFNQ